MKKDYRLIAKLAWEAFRIPIYLYENCELIDCYPLQESYLHPPKAYLQEFWKSNKLTYTTNYQSIFVKLTSRNDHSICFVCGPVSNYKYAPKMLMEMHKEYIISSGMHSTFDEFFCRIPVMTQGEFFRLMQLVYYMMNDEEISLSTFLSEILTVNGSEKKISRNLQTEVIYQNKEYGIRNDSYEIEKYIQQLVRRGDVKGMEDFIASVPAYHAGTVANDVLRMQKNYLITTITLITRAAIEAGLPSDQCFGLSDLYITRLEGLTNKKEIDQLTSEVLLNFTSQVKESINSSLVPVEIDGIPAVLVECMNYIKSHTNEKLSVQSVADEMGYDRAYLSNLFSKTLGFSMSAFIVRCKLEESKILLAYTDKSLKEISSFLCFSSQSHFQKRFRETFHVTPLNYRESGKSNSVM